MDKAPHSADPHRARFAKVAWPIVAEREGLPQPAKDYAPANDPDRVPIDYEDSEGLEFLSDDLRPIRGIAIGLGYSAIIWLVVAAATVVWMAS